jgi:hypothetical protein
LERVSGELAGARVDTDDARDDHERPGLDALAVERRTGSVRGRDDLPWHAGPPVRSRQCAAAGSHVGRISSAAHGLVLHASRRQDASPALTPPAVRAVDMMRPTLEARFWRASGHRGLSRRRVAAERRWPCLAGRSPVGTVCACSGEGVHPSRCGADGVSAASRAAPRDNGVMRRRSIVSRRVGSG